jgi:uncharacterized protein GlcG (DUF336 family)
MQSLSQKQAQSLLNFTISAADKQGNEVAIGVVDSGGHMLLFQRSLVAILGAISKVLDKAITVNVYQSPVSKMQTCLKDEELSYLATKQNLPMKGSVRVELGTVNARAIGIRGVPSEIDYLIATESVFLALAVVD